MSAGVDMQMLAKASKGDNWSRPRLCHINSNAKRDLGISIFPVRGQKDQYTVSTVTGSPAEGAGVRTGDRLVWVNGVTVSALTHSVLSRTVRRSSGCLTVLVVDGDSERCYVRRKMPILPLVAECRTLPHAAKTMHVVKGPDGYGFLLRQERLAVTRCVVHVLREVDAGSPAEAAGMEDGDLLLAVNEETVEFMEHEDIVKAIRNSADEVLLTTISLAGRNFYRGLGISPLLFYDQWTLQDERQQTAPHCTKTKPAAPGTDGDQDLTCPRTCVQDGQAHADCFLDHSANTQLSLRARDAFL